MNILFEINHPGHIHFFKNFIREVISKHILIKVIIKNDFIIEFLAKKYGLPYIVIGKKGNSLLKKYLYQIQFLYKTLIVSLKMKASLGIGISMTLPIISKLTKMKSISFDDDDISVTPIFARYANMADAILTPDALSFENRGNNHIKYSGYHELAYLHPHQFSPDISVLEELQVSVNEPFFILRFNSFSAHHDVNEYGISFDNKLRLIKLLSKKGKVFISSESKLENRFLKYQLKCDPEKIHSVLAFAQMYIGESQTMTTEAAVLGTPALKCNSFAGRLSIPNELEYKYGLCYSFLPEQFDKLLLKIDELLAFPDIKQEWQKRRKKMLADKIDVTAFLVWFVENYPESARIMKENPDYQYRFK